MTVQGFESFDKVTTTTMAAKSGTLTWTYVNSSFVTIGSSTGRNGGNGFGFTTTGSSVGATVIAPTARATMIVGWFGSPASAAQRWVGLGDATVTHVYLLMNGANKVEVYQGNGTLLGTSTNTVTVASHFQLKVKVDNSAGTFELRINGALETSGTGLDTQNGGTATADRLRLGQVAPGTGNGGTPASYDDLWFVDTQGSSPVNDFLGDCRIQALSPSAAGNTANFTPSTGSNYQNVDEATSNGDTDYNSDNTVGDKDTFAAGDLTPTAGTIFAVQHCVTARSDDAGSHTLKPVVRISGTDYDIGSGHAFSSSYICAVDLSETSPASSSAWSISEVNAMEIGYKKV